MRAYSEFIIAARSELKDGLALCTLGQQRKFKRIFGDAVDGIPESELEKAMRLVKRALDQALAPSAVID